MSSSVSPTAAAARVALLTATVPAAAAVVAAALADVPAAVFFLPTATGALILPGFLRFYSGTQRSRKLIN